MRKIGPGIGNSPGRPAAVLEGVLEAGILLLPLLCLAGLERPFSTPKTGLLVVLAAASAACYALRRLPLPDCAWMAWVAAVSVSALTAPWASFDATLLALLPVPLYLAVRGGSLPPERAARAVIRGSTVLAAVACLQFAGLDPLRLGGWQPEAFANPRMRVYGTLGNPAFVAAWLCAALPVTASTARGRPLRWAAAALQLGAIFATGSRIFLLAFPAAAAVTFSRDGRRAKWLLAGVPVAAALLWLAPARPLGETVEGRLYYARVVASRWSEIPVFGCGPGSFRPRFAAWQASWLKERGPDGAARFAGDVDHAHNDYLETLVEFGPAGLAAFLAFCAWAATASRPVRTAVAGGALGGAAALAAAALADFPFRRPAEWTLFWLLLALSAGNGPESDATQKKEELCRSHGNG